MPIKKKTLFEVNGSDFYNSRFGAINAKIVAGHSMILNDRLIKKYKKKKSCLIMGYGDGKLVDFFENKFSNLFVLEGSKKLCNIANRRFANNNKIKIINSYFEDYVTEIKFDIILANHVLEHVNDPIVVIKMVNQWLLPNGYVIFTTPNAQSLHRRIGVEMGIINDLYDFSENDKIVGHQRVYDLNSLISDCQKSGMKIIESGGFNLKIVSQKQMIDWSDKIFNALFEVSLKCPPEICSNIYVVCKKK